MNLSLLTVLCHGKNNSQLKELLKNNTELYTLVLLPPLLLRRGTKKVPFKEGAFC